jgi:hypothetical protein
MSRWAFKYIFFVVLWVCSTISSADENCAKPWMGKNCLGTLQFSFANPKLGNAVMTIRMTVYRNDEISMDLQKDGILQRLVVAKPSAVAMYLGLSDAEKKSPAQNPFMFLEMGYALPLGALQLAFPQGPISVPDSEIQRDVILEGKSVSIFAVRHGDNRVDFRLTVPEAGILKASGYWDGNHVDSLPGNFSLVGWSSTVPMEFKTLDDARAFAPKSKTLQ